MSGIANLNSQEFGCHEKPLPSFLCLCALLSFAPPTFAVERHDWAFISNSETSEGQPGRRFQIPHSGDPDGDWPCFADEVEADFSPSGTSWGISRNYGMSSEYDYLFVSISGKNGEDGCTVSEPLGCFGAAIVDLSLNELGVSPPLTYSWNQSNGCHDEVNEEEYHQCQAVDVVGNDLDVVIAEKWNDRIYQHKTGDTSVNFVSSTADEVTQVDWVDGYYYAATIAGNEEQHNSCTSDDTPWDGELWLASLNTAAPIKRLTVGGTDSGSKPEGLLVAAIDHASTSSCAETIEESLVWDYVAYVADWCKSRLYVYRIDIDAEVMDYVTDISLDYDKDDILSDYGEYCHPSAIGSVKGVTTNIYVLCQRRDTIIRLDTPDQCHPIWSHDEDEARLVKRIGGAEPGCYDGEPTLAYCNGGEDCSPHDTAFDPNVWPGWIFVTLTFQQQIVAVNRQDLTDQHVMAQWAQNMMPQDITVIPGCNPNSPECIYP